MFRFNLPNEPSVIKTGIKKLNRANEISLHSRLDITAYLNAKSRKLGEMKRENVLGSESPYGTQMQRIYCCCRLKNRGKLMLLRPKVNK